MFSHTSYKFPSRRLGKRPEKSKSVKLKRTKRPVTERILRYWQTKAFEKLYNSNLFLIKAFCGSGKTTLSIVLALYDTIKNSRKTIFIVPQSHIGDGFAISGKFCVPNLGTVNLCSANNFCENSPSKVDMLINFMLRKANFSDFKHEDEYVVDGSQGMVVCTHQAFNTAMRRIIADGKFDLAVKNTAFYVDEAHHIKGGEIDAKEDEVIKDYNQLGEVLYKIIDKADKNNSRVGLTTATFFRGDQGIIVKSEYLDKFDRYELEFLKHFETLGIEEVFINFEEYDDDPIHQIVENIRKELRSERHLVVVPTVVGKWRKNQDPTLEKLMRKLSRMVEEEGLNPDETILDLVPESTQDKNKSILLKEPKERYDEENNSKIRIVITCMLGREGTDWCPCSRLHNASIELGSPTLAVQTLGRLFRKFEQKETVGIIYYIKKFKGLLDSLSKREFLMDRVNAMLSLMIIDDLLCPIILPELPKCSSDKRPASKSSKKTKSEGIRLADVFGDDFEKIKKEMIDSLSVESSFDEETVNRIINTVITSYEFEDVVKVETSKGIKLTEKDNIIAGLKIFLLKARSEALRQKNIDVAEIRKNGFDILVENYGLGGNFWCGNLGKREFAKFKEIVGNIFWNKSQQMEIANNIRKFLPIEVGFSIQENNKSHEKIIRKTVGDLANFHKCYNEVAEKNNASTPSKKDVAERLDISLVELNRKVAFFNKLLPSGYAFFTKNSKITNKIAIDYAA